MSGLPPDAEERSLWHETAPPAPQTAALEGSADCDVAIIGAGIMGLCTGLALTLAGARVVVIEASAIGTGASGRNGGLVVPSLPRIGPDEVLAKLGDMRGGLLLRTVAGSAEAVFALIARHGIACEAVQSGWLNPAHAGSLVPRLAARAAAWRRFGARTVMLGAAETRARMGSQRYHGALFDLSGGHLNPLAYTRGLARAFLGAGGRLFSGSPVTALAHDVRWRLETANGTVTAETVVQCTNAQPPGLAGPEGSALRRSTVPLLVYQLATPVLPNSVRTAVLAGNEAFSDTRNNLLACRWTAQGRLVTGGMAAVQTGAISRLPGRLARRLADVFPALAGVPLDYVWRGRAALTGDFLPRLFQPAPGWLAPVGCNGRGIAMSTTLAAAIASWVQTRDNSALPIPFSPPQALPFHSLMHLLPQMLLPLGDLRDRLAERRS